jgi:phytanoyl-CoA hydroxylase
VSLRLTEQEKLGLEKDGFVVRQGVFGQEDVARLQDAAENLLTSLQEGAHAEKREHGSYVFETELEKAIIVKWEKGKNIVQGIEPFAHLDQTFSAYALDPRFIEPMKDVCGADEVDLFTEKLNLKRANDGGPVVLHQDHQSWSHQSDDVEKIATAILFLDDANETNGCLQVIPGSHKWGLQPTGPDESKKAEIDVNRFESMDQLVPVEVAAGSLVCFGPRLVHQSMPNTSDQDRRALLYSYQPTGNRHLLEFLRERWEREQQQAV